MMLGMLLDQQVTMEWAFGAPLLLKQRLGVAAARRRPRSRRWIPTRSRRCSATSPRCTAIPASMAKRTHDLCRAPRRELRRPGRGVWDDAATGDELLARVAGAARLRQGQGADLRRRARQAARRAARRAGSRPRPTGRRSPTSTRSSASPRSARRSARRRRRRSGRAPKPPPTKPSAIATAKIAGRRPRVDGRGADAADAWPVAAA